MIERLERSVNLLRSLARQVEVKLWSKMSGYSESDVSRAFEEDEAKRKNLVQPSQRANELPTQSRKRNTIDKS